MTSARTDRARVAGQAPLWELHHPAPELVAAWREAGLWRREPLPLRKADLRRQLREEADGD